MPEPRHNDGVTKLDEVDRQILRELQADGRLTHVTLAARVGMVMRVRIAVRTCEHTYKQS
jgi:DNA-binding Lrp family transcriptional regulator